MRVTIGILALLLAAGSITTSCESKSDESESGESASGEGESRGEAESASGSDDNDKDARRAKYKAAKASMETHAEAWEALVVGNDVEAIEDLWANPDDLAGCMRTEMDVVDGKQARVATDESWADEVAGNIEGMDSEYELIASTKHGETFKHKVNVWRNGGINEAFAGECPIEFHGEVWFDALVEGDESFTGIRHRAYFAQLGDAWRLLDIIGPETVECDNPADKHHPVCKKARGEE